MRAQNAFSVKGFLSKMILADCNDCGFTVLPETFHRQCSSMIPTFNMYSHTIFFIIFIYNKNDEIYFVKTNNSMEFP